MLVKAAASTELLTKQSVGAWLSAGENSMMLVCWCYLTFFLANMKCPQKLRLPLNFLFKVTRGVGGIHSS
jgi:hypothetical protein